MRQTSTFYSALFVQLLDVLTRQLMLSSRLAVAELVAAVMLAVPVTPQPAAQSQLPRFERSDCLVNGSWASDLRRECGWLVVPESRDRTGAHSVRTVRLAVEIFRARTPSGAPPLVFLHGGPGGAGGIRLFSEGIARGPFPLHRDVVIYDQRGAGFSQPKLCPAYERMADAAYNLRDDAEKDVRLTAAQRACIAELKAQGIDRFAYSTEASVADLIDLRRTLGYSSWQIYGASYGARLAQEAMARDARAIHSVVLASPGARGFSTRARQPLSTQRAFERVFAACRVQASCRDAFPNVEQDFDAAYDELTASPLPVPIVRPDSGRDTVWFNGQRLVSDIRDRILNRARPMVGRLPLLLHELRAGGGDRLRAAREIVGTGTASGAVADRVLRDLINCHDHDTYGTAYRKTIDSVNAVVRPPFRRDVARECDEWLPGLADRGMRAPVRSDIPTLIVTGHFDDRTPTEHARRIASTLSRAYVVELPDEGHDGREPGCHGALVAQFIEDPTKKPDTSCVAKIPPIPFTTIREPANVSAPKTAWTQVWSDEFDGAAGARIDSTKWNYETTDGCKQGICGWGNNEKEYYTDASENIVLNGQGQLMIVARRAPAGLTCYYGPCRYTSAKVTTRGKMLASPGRVEARIKLSPGQGLWPAFWMLGHNSPATPWPAVGEIDIMENKGSEPSTTSSALHGQGYSGATPFAHRHRLERGTIADFHTFAVEWDSLHVRFFVDDSAHYTITRPEVERFGKSVLDQPFFLILNLAVGGHFDGDPRSDAILPATMLVDYVRVYVRK
jgi:beta-glucanase (GH16 family)/pimeloyl-ACP methyl ester carboxylesterase